MKKIITFICACFVLIGSAVAQVAEQREYIYCTVDFSDNPNRKCEIFVDFGQHMKKLLPDTVNDRRLMGQFNSEMAAINWMSRNGWELFMYRPHMSEGSSYIRYVMRMDVTGILGYIHQFRIASCSSTLCVSLQLPPFPSQDRYRQFLQKKTRACVRSFPDMDFALYIHSAYRVRLIS